MPTEEIEGSRLSAVMLEGAEFFIMENDPLESLLFNRNLAPREFDQLCLQASRLCLSHLREDLLSSPELSELVVLSKGLVYQLHQAASYELGVSLPCNLIATRRASVEGRDARIEVSYSRFDAGGSTLLIGDTVASGATIVAALDAFRRHSRIDAVYLLSFAGALVGARRIAKYCVENGIRLTMLFGLAAFGLADNGFDLSFLHADTITHAPYRERAFTQFDGRPASAVGWDFGSQVMAPNKYRQLCWMEAEKWGLHGHASLSVEVEPTEPELLAGEAAAFLV